MHRFLHGWQRTIGVLTLVLALSSLGQLIYDNSRSGMCFILEHRFDLSLIPADAIPYVFLVIPTMPFAVYLLLSKPNGPKTI